MYNEEEKDIYYIHKLLISLMFDNERVSHKKVPWIYEIDTLKIFKVVVSAYAQQNCISNHIKDNIYNILLDGRNIKDKDYEERIQILNEITILLNSQKDDASLAFYVGQLANRRGTKNVKKYSLYDVQNEISCIDESIYNDFIVILSHSNDVSNEEFESIYLPNFLENNYYYESLNVILRECPSMFKDELFISRANQVLNTNKAIDKSFKEIDKKMKKLVKKYR